ncbi:MAG: hypothetical protein KF868_15755 [Acidobacteria bacterium]|nr:hypothetical protein [Acidobacteriota bacterium]MCW5967509.1 hypothetical protein [Blastocatellales bacterium]
MICREFSSVYSAILDGRAASEQHAALAGHLRTCLQCKRETGEWRAMLQELGSIDVRPQAPGLTEEILESLHREAKRRSVAARRRADLVDLWRLRLFSQSIGAVVSLALFVVMTMSVFRPAYRTLHLAREVILETAVIDRVPDEVRFRILLLEPPPPPPIFNPSGAVLGFTESLPAEDVVFATVEVRRDGRASVKEVSEPPSDPATVDRLSNALYRQASFVPARRKPRSADAVLMFSKINISG